MFLAVVLASGAAVKAADLENLKTSSVSSLDSLEASLDTLVKEFHGAPGGGHFNPQPAPHHPGGYDNHGGNHHPTPPPPPPPQPWHPQPGPWHPGPQPGPWNPHPNPGPLPPFPHPGPFPPPPPPIYNHQVRFDSGRFVWASDATRSFSEAVENLRRANVFVLEQRMNYDSYTIVFETRGYNQVQRYNSMTYAWSNEAERAANEMAMSYAYRGMIILEKNIRRDSFTISYFDPR